MLALLFLISITFSQTYPNFSFLMFDNTTKAQDETTNLINDIIDAYTFPTQIVADDNLPFVITNNTSRCYATIDKYDGIYSIVIMEK